MFLRGEYFEPSLALSVQGKNLMLACSPPFSTNIRLGCKYLPETNTLAYYRPSLVDRKKFYDIMIGWAFTIGDIWDSIVS